MAPLAQHDSHFDHPIPWDQYGAVFQHAHRVAQKLAHESLQVPSDKIKFIHETASELAKAPPPQVTEKNNDALIIHSILNLFEEQSENLIRNGANLIDWIEKEDNWWQRFMCEFPMDEYALMMADFLTQNSRLNGTILEIGAGIGNTSRKIIESIPASATYIRSDLNIKLLKRANLGGQVAFFDFDKPGRWQDLDLIIATNALHCAENKLTTLKNLRAMLKPDALLVMAEGAPYPKEDTPWALTYVCGIYDGWWNRGGFLTRESWCELLHEAGFKNIKFAKMQSDDFDLGGLIWAQA